jgi:hypothetical protein
MQYRSWLTLSFLVTAAVSSLTACGPTAPDHACEATTDIHTDALNCGACGHVCSNGATCGNGQCSNEPCNVGDSEACYDGQAGTEGVGPCKGGTRMCVAGGTWSQCSGEVVPVGEVCGDNLDNNCNGTVDENVDADGDGFTTCGGDCCDSTECSNPKAVNPGAFEVPGNGVDDNCDGMIDNAIPLCDTGLASDSSAPLDYAKAIDLCQTAMPNDKKWGVISATLTLADGSGAPNALSRSIRPRYGSGVMPKNGQSLMLISTGNAAATGDTKPGPDSNEDANMGKSSGFPSDFVGAHAGKLPNLTGCPEPAGNTANDPVMLTLKIRVPTNAGSFSLQTNFFSSEYPEWTCSPYNDFFVVLLDSAYSGSPANPADKNLAFYQPMGTTKIYPVGVNLAYGNTGLFSQCKNGKTGCELFATAGTTTACTSVAELAGTGMDKASPGTCDADSLIGGGTGWLTTSGNVKPGEIMTLRIAIWDTSDSALDSLAVIDNFKWSVDTSMPGTVIGKDAPSY